MFSNKISQDSSDFSKKRKLGDDFQENLISQVNIENVLGDHLITLISSNTENLEKVLSDFLTKLQNIPNIDFSKILNYKDKNDFSALKSAILDNNPKITNLLLNFGASTVEGNIEDSAFILAWQNEDKEIFNDLILPKFVSEFFSQSKDQQNNLFESLFKIINSDFYSYISNTGNENIPKYLEFQNLTHHYYDQYCNDQLHNLESATKELLGQSTSQVLE